MSDKTKSVIGAIIAILFSVPVTLATAGVAIPAWVPLFVQLGSSIALFVGIKVPYGNTVKN